MSIHKTILNLLPFHKKQTDKPDLGKFMAQMDLLLKEAHSQQVEQAKAAAADGAGPQTGRVPFRGVKPEARMS